MMTQHQHQHQHPGAATFTIMTQPHYNACSQTYENILVVNLLPKGPLASITRRVKPNYGYGNGNVYGYASRYRNAGINNCMTCMLALSRVLCNGGYNANGGYYGYQSGCCNDNSDGYMTPNDYPNLLSWLMANGYQVETQLTNMMNQSEVKVNGVNKVMCIATYYDPNTTTPPNITYMR